jgi:uncharacterized protein
VKLEHSFDVVALPAEAWAVLVDVERVAPCVPGASLTEKIDDKSYKGFMKVKLGPVSLVFEGEAKFVKRDDANFRAHIKAEGRESKGRGGAQADVDFSLVRSGEGSAVTIITDLTLNGPVAQYGRSQGIIAAVSEEMVARFAGCLREKVLMQNDGVAVSVPPKGSIAEQSTSPSGMGILFGALKRWFKNLFGGGF